MLQMRLELHSDERYVRKSVTLRYVYVYVYVTFKLPITHTSFYLFFVLSFLLSVFYNERNKGFRTFQAVQVQEEDDHLLNCDAHVPSLHL